MSTDINKMSLKKIKNRNTDIYKAILVFIVVFAFIAVSSILVIKNNNDAKVRFYKEAEKEITHKTLDNIQSEISIISKELVYLSKNSSFKNFLNNPQDSVFYNMLINDFCNFIYFNNIYNQIRYIDTSGMEIIRMNYNSGKPVIVDKKHLQNKKTRYYFKKSISLKKGEIYISPFDLNIENGKVEKPIKPVMRFVTPVFNPKNEKKGILIFNYLGSNLLNQLSQISDSVAGIKLMLVNKDGYWLKGYDNKKEWGFMFPDKKDITFAKDFPEEWERIKNDSIGMFETKNGIFSFKKIHPVKCQKQIKGATITHFDGGHWFLISYIPAEVVYGNCKHNLTTTIFVLIITGIVLFILILRFFKIMHLRKETEHSLMESELNFRLLFENSPLGTYIANPDGNITDANPALIKMLGSPSKEATKQINVLKYPPLVENGYADIFKKCLSTKEIQTMNSIYMTKWGKEVIFSTYIIPLTNNKGDVIKIYTIMEDVTERKKTESELIKSEQNLREINATKDKFFSIIAHDLRSPLGSIMGFSDLLMKNFDRITKEKQKEYIKLLNDTIKNTFNLLDNLLLWSRIQRGKISFHPDNENLYLTTAETIDVLKPMADNKQITIQNKINEEELVFADKNMLQTILRNLLSNAIKFTHKGGYIEVYINKKTNNDMIEICIKDSGVGIPPDIIPKLFDITDNISSKGTEKETGTGLGLILCNEFVNKHGGSITVESTLMEGSTFCFTVPTPQ